MGSGYYDGQSTMAIGVSAMSDGGNWVVKGNFSANTDGHVGVGAGALYQWEKSSLIYPLFVCDGENIKSEIESMPQ